MRLLLVPTATALLMMALLPVPALAGDGAAHHVLVDDFSFTDEASGTAATSASVGDTVTWTWVGGRHSVTQGVNGALDGALGGGFDSGNLNTGADVTFTQTFDEEGVFVYYCKLHPTMRGVVIVQ